MRSGFAPSPRFWRKSAASSALLAIVAQTTLIPAVGHVAHAKSGFEVGGAAPRAGKASLNSPSDAQNLLQALDQAVNEELMSNPELMEAVQDALDQEWPAIEATLPASPEEMASDTPAGEATPEPAPSPVPTPEPAPSPVPTVEAPAPSPAPSVVAPAPIATSAPDRAAPPRSQGPRESWDRVFGWDFTMGVPSGVGLAINVTPIRPITVAVGVTTPLGVTVTAHADVTLNILPIFFNSRWTPTVTVGYRYVHFTGLTDAAIDLISAGQLEQSDIAFQIKGTGLHMVSALAGLEYVSRKGFHFGLRGGYIWQLGDSVGQDDESGVVFSGFRSWSVLLMFGRRY